jgi:hypothetical protein
MFVAYEDMPSVDYRMMMISVEKYEFYISVLEDWLTHEKPRFVK